MMSVGMEHYGPGYSNNFPPISMSIHGGMPISTSSGPNSTSSRFPPQGYNQSQQVGQRSMNTIPGYQPTIATHPGVHGIINSNTINGQNHHTDWRHSGNRISNGVVSSSQQSLPSAPSRVPPPATTAPHRAQMASNPYSPSEQLVALSIGNQNIRTTTNRSSSNIPYNQSGLSYVESASSGSNRANSFNQGGVNFSETNPVATGSGGYVDMRDFPALPGTTFDVSPATKSTSNQFQIRDFEERVTSFAGSSQVENQKAKNTQIQSELQRSSIIPPPEKLTNEVDNEQMKRRLQQSAKSTYPQTQKPPANPNSQPTSLQPPNTQPPNPSPAPQASTNQPQQPIPLPTVLPTSTPSSAPSTPSPLQGQDPDPFGLLGLLRILKTTDRDLHMLSSGTDLTTLGLNLGSSDALYATFASPFSDVPLKREPEYQIPSCYYIRPPLAPPTDKMSLFSDETLFYIFYSMPKDALQFAAAAELQNRDWTYHTELKLWFQRSPGTTAQVKSNYEQGSYIYFDVQHWEKRRKTNFRMDYDKLYRLKT
uniref:NOT2/NOT3/NOT5 C-terminal domain-containing protein n=2 Tax=Arcella intermedia TaxID=1963864 RepID=A0A6B2L1G4_9EUKA